MEKVEKNKKYIGLKSKKTLLSILTILHQKYITPQHRKQRLS